MADEVEYPKRGYDTKDVEAMQAEGRKGRGRRWWLIALGALVAVPAGLFALWAWITLSFSYSSTDRAGYLQKFGKKGWLCKTWEGELAMVNMPGALPEIFHFSVRDDSIADELNKHIGNRVSLTYDQHKGVPTSCFGDTEYFVVGVRPLETLPVSPTPPTAAPVPPGAPAPAQGTRPPPSP
jgi:hypothetical protein